MVQTTVASQPYDEVVVRTLAILSPKVRNFFCPGRYLVDNAKYIVRDRRYPTISRSASKNLRRRFKVVVWRRPTKSRPILHNLMIFLRRSLGIFQRDLWLRRRKLLWGSWNTFWGDLRASDWGREVEAYDWLLVKLAPFEHWGITDILDPTFIALHISFLDISPIFLGGNYCSFIS